MRCTSMTGRKSFRLMRYDVPRRPERILPVTLEWMASSVHGRCDRDLVDQLRTSANGRHAPSPVEKLFGGRWFEKIVF
ncbi:hypothetical protein PGT21_025809 [Puccinia graminis f. sp. tritici]|uniref:Uncharacterized protein n=1 Tax=Puccinia graminis f. sp. tritici TaxID=56615 RepID=A0A5B0PBI3_PUCGR|nr:hypothetical protein PGT21_025809 [Puccinia graminis f. sp. tritici]